MACRIFNNMIVCGSFKDGGKETHDLEGTIKAFSEKGILLELLEDPTTEIWFPRSQCEGWEGCKIGDEITLRVPMWLIEKKEQELGHEIY